MLFAIGSLFYWLAYRATDKPDVITFAVLTGVFWSQVGAVFVAHWLR